jgi:beta-galactosidase
LRGYRLLIAPTLLLVDDELVKVLQDYVSGGGHLVLTIRSGMKDRYNALLPQRQPGPLAEMAGIEVEDYYALQDPVPVKGNWFEGQSRIWAERLRLLSSSTRIIARYGKANGWLDDQVAISVNSLKNGLVYYVGAYLDETAQQALMTKVLKIARITTISSPPGVEVSKRVRPDNVEIYFFINHKPVEQPIQFPWPVREHLSGFELPSEFKLEPYGVVIVTPISAD